MVTTRVYQAGDEIQEVEFDRHVVADWPWPVAFSEDGLVRTVSDPSFDPSHFIYAMDGDKMVGKAEIWWIRRLDDGIKTAFVMFPKTLEGYEEVRKPLIDHATRVLIVSDVKKIQLRGSTMCEGSIEWLHDHGYSVEPDQPRGYKKYVSYDLGKGATSIPTQTVVELDMERDRSDIAHAASIWMCCSPESAIQSVERLLEEEDAIAQLGVRQNGEITAAALVGKNGYRPTTAAFYYVYARNARALRQLAAGAIDVCIEQGTGDLLVDLINAHRCFEPTYLDMGFVEVADHAMFEKVIA